MDIKQKAINGVLGEYYDPYCGRFNIPMKDINVENTEVILELLRNGYAMSAYENEDGMLCYTIFCLEIDCSGYRDITICKKKLSDIERSFNYNYFTKVSFNNYSKNVQNIIDTVLLKTSSFDEQVEDYSIVVICDGNCFKFVEALDVCC